MGRSRKKKSGKTARAVNAAADRMGLNYHVEHDGKYHRELLFLNGFAKSASTKQLITGELDGRHLTIIEQVQMVFTGQAMIPVPRCAFVIDGSSLWPDLFIGRRNPFGRLAFKLGMRRGLLLERAAFNAGFHVKAEDKDFALALLTPELQDLVCDNTALRWQLGHSRLALIYPGWLNAERLGQFLDRLGQFLVLIPDELRD